MGRSDGGREEVQARGAAGLLQLRHDVRDDGAVCWDGFKRQRADFVSVRGIPERVEKVLVPAISGRRVQLLDLAPNIGAHVHVDMSATVQKSRRSRPQHRERWELVPERCVGSTVGDPCSSTLSSEKRCGMAVHGADERAAARRERGLLHAPRITP